MAILSKIRDRSIALIAVIGLALFAFVLDPSQLSDFFSSSKINKVGEINGESISRQEFSESLDNYRARTRNRVSEMQAAKYVWDNLVREKIYTQQLEEAGITIGEEDVWNQVIQSPTIANNPQFQNEAGLFDEEKFKTFLKETQENEDQQLWLAWQNFMIQLSNGFKNNTYNNLVNAGLGASLKEGEYKYLEENTKYTADFLYIPYSTVNDSLIEITKGDVRSYIEDHESEYQVESSRSLSYVKFDVEASEEDKENLKESLKSIIEDKKEYNAVSKREEVVKGFASASDYAAFFQDNQSDINLFDIYRVKNDLSEAVRNQIVKGKVGEVFGPYLEGNFYKLIKLTDIIRRPDSVKSSHIIIPYVGSRGAQPTTVKTEDQAKKSADSILKLVRRNKKKFAEIANELNTDASKGKDGDIGWVAHRNAMSQGFDAEYAKFIFDNKKGKVGVVKSQFGFHVIRIDDQKNYQNAYRTVVFGKQIEASEKTENLTFQKAEQFSLELSKGDDTFYNIAREKNYKTQQGVGLKVLDDRVPGINTNARQIISWSFQKDTEVGDFKRFDLDNAYVVAFVTDREDEGLMRAGKAINRVRPLMTSKKKGAIIMERMNGNTLEEIAKNNNREVKQLSDVSFASPTIPGVGFEPNVMGAMYKAEKGVLINKILGKRGVYAFVLKEKKLPTPLPNYDTYRNQIANKDQNRTTKIFTAIKKESDIEDNRAFYYGIDL